MEQVQQGADVFFLLMGAILVFAMHGGFAFLEVGTVRHKNQVNALVKILVDFAISTITYFFIGYWVAYGVTFLSNAGTISGGDYGPQGLGLVKFFFLCTFAAAVPAIISGGIAERAKFWPQAVATAMIVGLAYPFFEGIVWNKNFGLQQNFFAAVLGAEFKDFAGSIVVHAVGGWIALAAVLRLGARSGRYEKGRSIATPPSSLPWLAMGSWLLCVGWFGFNVMSAQSLKGVSGLVAVNSLMAMCGGIIAALIAGRNDPGFVHNGALAGLVAVCAGSDIMHPAGAMATGRGRAEALMKGHLHTDVFMKAVLNKEAGLRIGKPLTHISHLTVPGRAGSLILTDGALNPAPDIELKKVIIANAIALAHALGNARPKVALLSATEVPSPRIPSTTEAVELTKWAKDAIHDADVDGPLAFDLCVSPEAVKVKGVVSPVAGAADILIMPEIVVGNALMKMMTQFMGACMGGVVLGAKVPILLTSRSDPAAARLASAALAAAMRNWEQRQSA
mgnify:CR=1 FL=1